MINASFNRRTLMSRLYAYVYTDSFAYFYGAGLLGQA